MITKGPFKKEKKSWHKETRRRVCQFCADSRRIIDYKEVDILKKFLSLRGKIQSRRSTKNCAKHQRLVAVAIKRSRHVALLPFTIK